MDAALRGPRPRVALIVTALAPVMPQLLGSAFNIWYNLSVVEPLLGTEALKARFLQTVIYLQRVRLSRRDVRLAAPRPFHRPGFAGAPFRRGTEARALARARRRAINLPWSIMAISGVAWFLCVPVFLISLGRAGCV